MELYYDQVKTVFAKKNFKFYLGNLNLNVFGIRMPNRRSDKFDDFICVAYEKNRQQIVHCWEGTTDPGQHWLENPMNAKGAAILVPGQYHVYSIDMHRGAYKALCQRRGPVKTYRDGDRDAIIDINASTITSGDYGINIHRAGANGKASAVGKNSAGCQVFEDSRNFDLLMSLAYDAEKIYGNKFTYTLFEAKDFGLA